MSAICAISTCFVILCTLGCVGSEVPKPLVIRPLARGGFTGLPNAREETVKDAKRWEKIWAEHRGKSTTPCPEVDFGKEMVIVTTLGLQRTGGYSIQVVKVEAIAGKLKIRVKRTMPRPGSRAIQVLTAPFDFVAITRSDLPVEFVAEDKPADK